VSTLHLEKPQARKVTFSKPKTAFLADWGGKNISGEKSDIFSA